MEFFGWVPQNNENNYFQIKEFIEILFSTFKNRRFRRFYLLLQSFKGSIKKADNHYHLLFSISVCFGL